MLKIKDNVDLKELEKFGFEYEHILQIYYKLIIPHKLKILIFNYIPKARVIIVEKDKKIIAKRMDYWLDWNECEINKKDIKDLIKADLVEKVSDNNAKRDI